MRHGQLGLAVRQLEGRLDALQAMIPMAAAGHAETVEAMRVHAAELEADRQLVLAEAENLDQAATALEKFCNAGHGWGGSVEFQLSEFDKRYQSFRFFLDKLDGAA